MAVHRLHKYTRLAKRYVTVGQSVANRINLANTSAQIGRGFVADSGVTE